MKKSLRQFVADNIHSLIFLVVLLFILIVGLIVRSVIRSHMKDPTKEIYSELGEINPTVLVNGEYYEWRKGNAILTRQFADEEPDWEKEKGMIYYGKIKRTRSDLPKKDREFASSFKATGKIYLDPKFDDIIYLKVNTEWLEDKFVIFDKISEEVALNNGIREYSDWDRKWFETMDYPLTTEIAGKFPLSEAKDILNPPKEMLHYISYQKMAKLMIQYPLFDSSVDFDYSDKDCFLDFLSDSNLYNEIIRSDDGIECFLDEYQCTKFDPKTDSTNRAKLNVEMFGHQFIENNMDYFNEANKALCREVILIKEKIYADIEDDDIRNLLSFDDD